jgi:hypothetical protein
MNLRSLPDNEWDFSGVPDDELFACLVYEYGRESRTFMYSQELSEAEERLRPHRLDYEAFHQAGAKGELPTIVNTPEEQAAAKETVEYLTKVARFDQEAFLHAFWSCDQGFTEIFDLARRLANAYSAPWLAMPAHLRKQIAHSAKESHVFGPMKPALLRELELVWEQNAQDLKRLREHPELQKYGDEEDCELYNLTNPVRWNSDCTDEDRNATIAAFSIDFGRYSNAQIVAAFQTWLNSARPPDCPEPIQRGKKKSDSRAALDWLGTMRILHHCSWRDPRFPKTLKNRGELACYKARKRARDKFHEIFPFLPASEDPHSWLTAAERARRKKSNPFPASI